MRLLAGLATLLTVLGFATGVSAHASLIATEPVDGSVLAVAPKTVQLRFNEDVAPGVIRLIDSAGKVRDDATAHVVDQAIEIVLPSDLPRGTQLVSYRVISQDGHPVGGSMVFSIGAATAAATVPTEPSSVGWLIWLARIGIYIGLFVGVGGAFFVCWIASVRAVSDLIAAALVVGLLGIVPSLGLQGLDVLGLPLGAIAIPAVWNSALATSLGPSLLIAAAALAAALLALRTASVTTARLLSAVAMVAAGLSLAATGHAATASPQWLTRTAVFVHGVGVAFWVGALLPLAAMGWRQDASLLAVLQRFSRLAVPVVAVLVLTGLTLAVIELESFGALVETSYGQILSVKLALVLVLLGLAALNRLYLTPTLARDGSSRRSLVWSILLEGVAALAILATVAGWRFTVPPRTLAAEAATPLAIHIHTANAMFQVLISPGKVGTDGFVLQLMNGDATPLHAKEATLTLSLPERGIEPLEHQATLGADGYWHVREVPIPYPGRWHMRIDALVNDFKKVTLEDEFDVAAR